MAKSKEISSKVASFAKGGTTKMFGKQHAGQQKAGQTSTKSGTGGQFAKGGKTKMYGFAKSAPKKPSVTAAR